MVLQGLELLILWDPCTVLQPYNLEPGQINSIDGNINYFAAQDICLPPGDWDNPLPNPGTGSGVNSSTDRGIQYASNLQPCINKRNIVFGESFECEEKFSETSRVKTKAFRQNYLVTRSVGQEVKHQTRTVFWFRSSVDELRNGTNFTYFEYNLPKGVIGNSGLQGDIKKELIHNGEIFSSVRDFISERWVHCPSISCGSVDMSEFHSFFNAEINTILLITYDDDDGKNKIIERDKFFQEIWPEEEQKLKALSQTLGVNYDDLPILVVQMGTKKVSLFYKNYSEKERNSGKFESTYLRDSYFKLSLKKDGIKPWKLKEIKLQGGSFENASYDIYGIARKNSVWKGSRVVASE